jgi:hypothetical protein
VDKGDQKGINFIPVRKEEFYLKLVCNIVRFVLRFGA